MDMSARLARGEGTGIVEDNRRLGPDDEVGRLMGDLNAWAGFACEEMDLENERVWQVAVSW
jgi:hypothetical protein